MKLKRAKRSFTLPKSFKNNESFKHDLAKGLMYEWFSKAERYKRQGQSCKFGGICWNKSAGVHEELPFFDNSSPYYFEHPPKFPGKILFIPDLTVFQEGHAHLIFEIVHKSDISEVKAERLRTFFKDHFVEIHVIQADWILSNTSVPKYLQTTILDLAA